MMANENGEKLDYDYEDIADGEEGVEYEYVEAPAAEDGVEYEYVEEPAPEAPAAEEGVEYEYVEEPAPEAPAAEEGVEYEYVEEPAPEAPAAVEESEPALPPETETPAGTEEEALSADNLESLPAGEEKEPSAETEAPAGTEEEALSADDLESLSADEGNEPPLPPETGNPLVQGEDPLSADDLESLSADEENEPPLPPEEGSYGLSSVALETLSGETPEEPVAEQETPAEPETAPGVVETAAVAVAVAAAAAVTAPAEEEKPTPAPAAQTGGDFVYDGASGPAAFTGTEASSAVVLSNAKGRFTRLGDWHLQITETSVSQIEGQAGQTVVLPDGVYSHGVLITGEGEQIPFANVSELTVPAADPDQCTLMLSNMTTMALTGHAGETVELDNASGLLVGPDDAVLYFSGLNRLVIPEIVETAEGPAPVRAVSANEPLVRLSGGGEPSGKAFVFAAGDGEKKTDAAVILVKTGYTTYGWNVVFDDGTTMSLADVRTFQAKHDALPAANGTIAYRGAKLSFSGAKKIKVVEKPAYCGYGIAPEKAD